MYDESELVLSDDRWNGFYKIGKSYLRKKQHARINVYTG